MKEFLLGVGAFGVLCLAASFIGPDSPPPMGPQGQAVSSSSQNFIKVQQLNKDPALININAITYMYPDGNSTRVSFLNGSYMNVNETYSKMASTVMNLRLK